MAVRLKNSNRRNDVRHYRPVHSDLLDFAGLSSNLAYITSVFIGYIGTDSIGSLIKRFAAKKPEKMVEITNQRKAFLDMLWPEGTDNGRQKTRNHGYDVIVGGELFNDYSMITLANLSRWNQNSNHQQARIRGTASFPLVGCSTASSLAWKTSLRKAGRCGIAVMKERMLYRDWSWWYPSGNRPLQQYPGFTAALVMSSGAYAYSLIAKFKEAGGTVREIDVWAESPRLSPLCYPVTIVYWPRAVNHYR